MPLPDERAVIQHKDLIGILMEAARCDTRNTVTFASGADGLAQARVRGIVQRGGAVVQDENFGVAHERTGNGQALALAAGEVLAALRDPAFKPPSRVETNSAACEVSSATCSSASVASSFAPAEILRDGPGKQDGLLRHDADLAAQLPGRIVAHVDAVDEDAPGRRVIEAGG